MDHVLEDQIKMGPATLRKSVKPRAEQILELAPPDMVSVVHVSRVGFGSLGSGLSDPKPEIPRFSGSGRVSDIFGFLHTLHVS